MTRSTGSNPKFIILFLVVFTALPLFCQELKAQVSSYFDFSDRDLAKHPAALEGNWNFYWNELLPPGSNFSQKDSETIRVPDPWNKNKRHPADGYGTFRTMVYLPPGSDILGLSFAYSLNHYKLYVNGKLIHQNGIPGTLWVRNPQNQSPVIKIIPREMPLEIIVEVSNFYDFYGGILDAPILGNYETLNLHKKRSEIMEAFLFGVFLVIGILYILFYLSESKESQSSLFFGLFALVLSLRTLLYGQHLLLVLYPGLSVGLESALGHLTFYLAVPLFLRFIVLEYPFKNSKYIEIPLYVISLAYCLLAIVKKHSFYIDFLIYYQIISMIVASTIFGVLVLRSLRKDISARVMLFGFLILLGTAVNDILYSQKVIETFHMTPLGLGLFILGQATLLSWKIGKSFRESKDLSIELKTTNQSFRRFVPEEFLTYLNRTNIRDVQLGDHTEMDMTVMFIDIRDFTSLSEIMTPRENFLFLNSYYKRVCPVIRNHSGFIDKYMGDGIMALFAGPDSSESAVTAAISMRKVLKLYNSHRAKTGYAPVRVGIGIHTGSLMMGTIGENKRMDGTVISDAVNLCSRIESLTKEYGLDIALSDKTYNRLKSKEQKLVRFIGNIKVKGKQIPVGIYELFNGDEPDIQEMKIKTKAEFEQAVKLRENREFDESKSAFEKVLEDFPEDKTTSIYLSRFRKSVS